MRPLTPARPARRSFSSRCAQLFLLSFVSLLLLAAASARADSSSAMTVVGTSDLSDSGLIPNLIQPGFEKAYPQFTFKYIGTATGTAITDAESGSVGASVLIVHAASVENQFVAGGYSYEKYGRALFINDFVLGGPKADPAGVAANGAHNIAQAFADVAAAGINGGGTPKVTFVSRGGTPGTTIEEHAIWTLVSSSGLAPSGLLLCSVSSSDGGGETPIAAGNGVTASGQPCPGGLPSSTQLPSWYLATGLTQGPNVVAANSCSSGNIKSGANTCYVLTDRGTYDYLASGTDPAGSIPNLQIVTRDQSASAPGGADALINHFHGYIINPSKPNETVNLTAAQDFLNYVTSAAVQAQLKNYLATADPGGPPFKADASPIITGKIPRSYNAAKRVTVSGTLTNAEPGYPALAGQTVTISQLVAGLPVPVDTGKTNSKGAFRIAFKPTATGSYELTTSQIAKIEDTTLNPPFGDLLSPAASTPARVTVRSAITALRVRSTGGGADVFGSVGPGSGHVHGVVKILARRPGSKRYTAIATDRLASGDGNFAAAVTLGAGRWQIEVTFRDPGRVVGAKSKSLNVTIGPRPTTSVRFRAIKGIHGPMTVTAGLSPAATGAVELLALETSGGPAHFAVVAKAASKGGTAALHARLRRGVRWALQLVYHASGQAASYSELRTVNVR